jgi:ankyrin repeat protein
LKKFKETKGLDNYDEEIEKYLNFFKCDESKIFEKACNLKNEKFCMKLMKRKNFNYNFADEMGNTNIMFACAKGLENVCLKLIDGLDDNTLNRINMYRNTILILACNQKMEKLIEKILDRNLSCIEQKNDYGKTAYDMALDKKLFNIAYKIKEKLKKNGIVSSIRLSNRASNKWSDSS